MPDWIYWVIKNSSVYDKMGFVIPDPGDELFLMRHNATTSMDLRLRALMNLHELVQF